MADATRTTLYIPSGLDLWRRLVPMAHWAERHELDVEGYVRDWRELIGLLGCGEYDIGVIPSWDHLRPDRVPRLVAMEDRLPVPPTRRPRPEVSRPERLWF